MPSPLSSSGRFSDVKIALLSRQCLECRAFQSADLALIPLASALAVPFLSRLTRSQPPLMRPPKATSALCHCGRGAKGTQNGNHHQPQFSREFSKKVKDQRSSSLPQLARKLSNPRDQRTANQPQIQGNHWMKKLWPLVRQHSSNPIRQKIPVNSQHLALITQKKVVVQRVQSDGLKR